MANPYPFPISFPASMSTLRKLISSHASCESSSTPISLNMTSKFSYHYFFQTIITTMRILFIRILMMKRRKKPAPRLLLKEGPLSTTQFLLMILDPVVTDPFHLMGTWCQMNNHGNHDHPASPFEMAHGRTFWGLAAQQPKFGSLFNEAMEADSQLLARAVIDECEGIFEGLNSLVDVGGGTGTMAKAIAKAFPNIHCTVFDQPHVVANLQGTHNLDFVGGDMFEKIPPANAISLKWILHDWSDEESVKILKKSREAILSKNEGGKKVIILDINVSADNKKMDKKSIETQLMWDMLMMVDLNGKERSEVEWEKLFLTAGFSHNKITHTLGLRSLIEVYP
ncbi:unnamed protein product [Prunus brigantina]